MRHLLCAWVITTLVSLPALASEPVPPCKLPTARSQSDPYVIKIGYTTFESAAAVRTSSTLNSVTNYLSLVSAESQSGIWRRPLQFDLTLGNYYQIWSWFRAGLIDAAIVSPFMAMLLERDVQAIPVLEFAEYSADASYAGHRPLIAASGRWREDPVEGLSTYLEALLKAADAGAPEASADTEVAALASYRMNLVAHLSSSGFVMPTLYARAWLDRRSSDGKAIDAETKRRFWQLYFQRARLTLMHAALPGSEGVTDFYFSYDGRDPQRLKEEREGNGLGDWLPYTVPPFPADQPSIPNDVFVIRRQVAEEAVGIKGIDRSVLSEELTAPCLQQPFEGTTGGYYRVRWFNPSMHGPFRSQVERLFSRASDNAELARLNERWFESERFDFTIDETMAFLRQDQANSGTARLALVLSGGGVKSLYQTVLLDYLYGLEPKGQGVLRNYDEAPGGGVGPTPRNTPGPLTVHSIIGTSGGAMLAFFAAQLPAVGELTERLARTAAKPLFPPTDLPRLFSAFVLVVVLLLALAVVKAFNVAGIGVEAAEAVYKRAPWVLLGFFGALLFGGAAAITFTRSADIESVPGVEGTLYVVTVLLVHFGVTCIAGGGGRSGGRERFLGRLALLGMGCGVLLLLLAGIARSVVETQIPARHDAAAPPLSILAGASVVLIAAAIATAGAAGKWRLRLHDVREYRAGMLVVIVFVLICYVSISILTALGIASQLELTPNFWLTLVACGAVAAIVVVAAAVVLARRGKTLLRRGIVALVRDRRGTFALSMGTALATAGGFGIACWVLMVAPAIYGNAPALTALREALSEDELWTNRFRSNLVVTGTLLNDVNCGGPTGTVRSGGLYFCFEGTEGCGLTRGGAWQVFHRPAPARAVDAVFASGSAFPVFPAHRTHLPNGCEVRLVDGGYAHNVPLEAASLSAARQVLILNASPDLSDTPSLPMSKWRRWARHLRLEGSQLLRYAPDLFGFMFARAQELDRNVGSNLVVASLSPNPPDGTWPFLLDFRPSVQGWMIRTATEDIAQKHRIGHVLSWGLPLAAVRIDQSPRTQPAPRGWSQPIKAQVQTLLRRPGNGAVAAFDLDNTTLRGDIGDAMFLKMVVELRYHGERDEFWDLFSEIGARRELRRYWERFAGQPRRSYLRPVEWDPDFTDYVVLFYRQYERLLEQRDGPRVAYPWVTKLLVGTEPTAARDLAREVWRDEMNRPMGNTSVRSDRFGTLTLEGGVRPRSEMRNLITDLTAAGWNVWIVTASNAYVGRAAAEKLGVSADRVIGIELKRDTKTGTLTSVPEQPIPYRDGKRKALLARGLRPVLALGDSPTDIEMLDLAEVTIVIDRGKIEPGTLRRPPLLQRPESLRTEIVR